MVLPRALYLLLPFPVIASSIVIITEIVTVKTVATINAGTRSTSQPVAAKTPIIANVASKPLELNTSDNEFIDSILESSNTFRKQHNAYPLSWNNTLASYAASHASDCVFQHTNGPYGENLASGYASLKAAVDGWGNERTQYNFASGDFSKSTGHFTQLVWKATNSVGCGRVYCNKPGTPGWFLVCEYFPRVSDPFLQHCFARGGYHPTEAIVTPSMEIWY